MLKEPCDLALFQEEMMLLYCYLNFCLSFFSQSKIIAYFGCISYFCSVCQSDFPRITCIQISGGAY